MGVGCILGFAKVIAKNNEVWQMNATTPNITPHTSNLEDEDLHFVNFVGTCPCLGMWMY
jgi:hypothetical protein